MSGTAHNANLLNATLDEALIERIVREVLSRVANRSTSRETQCASSSDFRVEGRVVTLESLRECGDDAKRVIVASRAVVTPAVVDEIKDRGLTLVRCDSSPAFANRAKTQAESKKRERGSELTIGRVDSASGPGWDAVKRFGHATINGGLVSVLPRLAKQLSSGGQGVLVTSAPAATVYHACQHGLRAVYATNGRDVGEARSEFDANLLVVDSQGASNGALESFLTAD